MSELDILQKRVDRMNQVLSLNGSDDHFETLVDLLTDAMHWCDALGHDFHYAFCLASSHFIAEHNNHSTRSETQFEKETHL